MRWFEVESRFRHDARIKSIREKFRKDGLGSLFLLWGEIADQGARPGIGVDRHGDPLTVRYLAQAVGLTERRFRALIDFCAAIGHVDEQRWKRDGVIVLPAMVRRARRLAEPRDQAERKAEQRERRFARIAQRDGKRCCRCGDVEQLELERKTPVEEGGGTEYENVQIVCVPCGRKRRAARVSDRDTHHAGGAEVPLSRIPEGSGMDPEGPDSFRKIAERPAERPQNVPQDACTGSTGTGGVNPEISSPHTHSARAREIEPPAEPPAPSLFPHYVAAFTGGTFPRAHLRCLAPCGVKCYPLQLAEEHARALNMSDKDAAMDRIRAFRDEVLGSIPEGQPVSDNPFVFWRKHFEASFPSYLPESSVARDDRARQGRRRPAAAATSESHKSPANVWEVVQRRLLGIKQHDRETWFGGSQFIEQQGTILRVRHDAHRASWIDNHYGEELRKALTGEGFTAIEWDTRSSVSEQEALCNVS